VHYHGSRVDRRPGLPARTLRPHQAGNANHGERRAKRSQHAQSTSAVPQAGRRSRGGRRNRGNSRIGVLQRSRKARPVVRGPTAWVAQDRIGLVYGLHLLRRIGRAVHVRMGLHGESPIGTSDGCCPRVWLDLQGLVVVAARCGAISIRSTEHDRARSDPRARADPRCDRLQRASVRQGVPYAAQSDSRILDQFSSCHQPDSRSVTRSEAFD